MYQNEMWEVGNTAPRTSRGPDVVKGGDSVVIRDKVTEIKA